MINMRLQDDQWSKILDFLRNDPHAYVGKIEEDCRRFVEGVLWVSRSGAQWRLLPDEYGKWNTVYKRFARWCDKGVLERMLLHFADDPDMENGMIDSTIVRAHPCAAGAEKNGGQANQELGRSRGGFSTKVHVTVDGLGNPLRLRLTAGHRHDIIQAVELVDGFAFEQLIADRGYAAQEYFDWIVEYGIKPVIPAHGRSKKEREYDK